MCAALGAEPAAGASEAHGQSLNAASPSPTRVKYYIVPPAGQGAAASLFVIAARTLGNGNRFMEIFNLNRGRPQRAGGRLENPHVIEPGWILQLPADAAGPGVHFGPLPRTSASPSAPAAPRPTPRAVSAPPAPGQGINVAEVAGGVLIILAVAGLAFMFSRRRRTRGKKATHARPVRPRPSLPSRPTAGHAGRFGPDHPSWPATDLSPVPSTDDPGQPGLDYPRWPGPDLPRASADYPGRPGPGYPRGSGPDGWSTQLTMAAPASGPGAYGVTSGDVRLTDVPVGRGAVTGLRARPEATIQLSPAGLADPAQTSAGAVLNADSVRLAERILSGADNQAAATVAAAEQQAAQIKEQAAELKQKAADEAAATLAAAEQEAAELRAAILKMSAELSGVATYVTERLVSPAKPAGRPGSAPGTHPAPGAHPDAAAADRSVTLPADRATRTTGRPQARPGSRTARRSTARPAAQAAARTATKPALKKNGRQINAMRKMVAAFVLVFLIGTVSGATEIALHGFAFFVFRANGAGASVTGPTEDQGPGQPDAPGAHHPSIKPSTRPSSTSSTKPGGKAVTKPGSGPHSKPTGKPK